MSIISTTFTQNHTKKFHIKLSELEINLKSLNQNTILNIEKSIPTTNTYFQCLETGALITKNEIAIHINSLLKDYNYIPDNNIFKIETTNMAII